MRRHRWTPRLSLHRRNPVIITKCVIVMIPKRIRWRWTIFWASFKRRYFCDVAWWLIIYTFNLDILKRRKYMLPLNICVFNIYFTIYVTQWYNNVAWLRTLKLASFLLFALLLLTGVNSSLILLLVKCNKERDWPGRGGPLTACDISSVGFDSKKEILFL